MSLELVGKGLFTFVLLFYYSIYNTIRFFIPYKYRSKSIKNEIALVTGGGNGIGKSLAKKMAKQGATVVLWDVDEKGNDTTKKEIEADGGKAYAYKCDLTKKEDVYRLAEQVKKDVGDVTILVNNAGIVSGRKFLDLTDIQIERTFQVNTLAHFWTTRSFLPKMLENNHGHIVTIASMAGLAGSSGLVDYCSSKFGAVGFDESLRNELIRLGKRGVNTTVVCPAGINTGLFTGFELKNIPMMDTEYVTDRVLEAILTNQKQLLLPRDMYFTTALKYILPHEVSEYMAELFGVNNSMDNFVGHNKKKEN